jgi:hypothetical protein
MKFRIVFWDLLPCKIIVDRHFRGTCCLHHQGWQYIPEDNSEVLLVFITISIGQTIYNLYLNKQIMNYFNYSWIEEM